VLKIAVLNFSDKMIFALQQIGDLARESPLESLRGLAISFIFAKQLYKTNPSLARMI
jgi:hypothetical protein